MKKYDVIVVGAGHAGCEASLASARMGHDVLVLINNIDNIGQMSCNPAIGGLAKGQMVKEIDALGGEMGLAIDHAGIQFRTLNTKKGPAVRSSRAQADRAEYRAYMKWVLENQDNLDIKQGMAAEIIVEGDGSEKKVIGVRTEIGEEYYGKAVILTTGTFLKGVVHIGDVSYPAGRFGDPPAQTLSDSLKSAGITIKRFSTSTTPRLDGKTINWDRTTLQPLQTPINPFSFRSGPIEKVQLPCYLTYTNQKTHDIIRDGVDSASIITGTIAGAGPRYCPSIEEKVIRFPEKPRHQIFLEPEGKKTHEIYANGLFTSLSIDSQLEMLHSIAGLEEVEIMRPAYAIEYDFSPSTQLLPSLETRVVKNLFFAGQINGTSGYEEAAAQGIMAGINASLKIRGESPLILKRSEAYIGVLIDDLVTKGTNEPYRMFTSRAEYRLNLREGNSTLRLTPYGREIGLIKDDEWKLFLEWKKAYEKGLDLVERNINPTKYVNERLSEIGIADLKKQVKLKEVLRRPGVDIETIKDIAPELSEISPDIKSEVELHAKYEGYLKRQDDDIKRFKKMEDLKIPDNFQYRGLSGLSSEVTEKLEYSKPLSLGHALRIPGVTPAAISILLIHLKRISAL